CHDHKFDPLTQKDFYQLAAFFNNTTQSAMDGNIKDTPPIIVVPQNDDRARYFELDKLIEENRSATKARRDSARAAFEAFLSKAEEREKIVWQPLESQESLETHVPLASSDTKSLDSIHKGHWHPLRLDQEASLVPGVIADFAWQIKDVFPSLPAGDVERDQPFTVALWVKGSGDNQSGSLIARMDESNGHRGWDVWLEKGLSGMHLVHRWPDNALKVVTKTKLQPGRWQHVAITYDGSSKPEGINIRIDGNEVPKNMPSKGLSDTTRTTVPLTIGRRSEGSPAKDVHIQDVRIYRKLLVGSEIAQLASVPRLRHLASKPNRSVEETDEFYSWYLATHDSEFKQVDEQAKTLASEKDMLKLRGTVAHVMNENKDAAKAFVLTRGAYDKPTTEVSPEIPPVLPAMQEGLPRNRLGFAKWLLQSNHPLTARVTVNRFWQEVFGLGLVSSSGDFGATGQMPTHPELLDYLAISFRDDGWNVKGLFRLIVTSATYRQSASVTQEKLSMDPTNKWLSRGPRFRMDAEMIRDSALSVSGLLVRRIGGPSVRPYQPPGVWEAVAMPESNTRKYVMDEGEGLYRRSVYTFLKRSAPPPNMDAFNATAREVCTIKRERTNTPLQALVTLNDIQFVEAARILASRILLDAKLTGDNSARLQSLANRLIARPFRADELGIVSASFDELQAFYLQHPDLAEKLLSEGASKSDASLNPSELAAWTMLVNELMNLDEVLTK
ncbi:MAG: DUF1553 domain-containing protein, partial [Pirellula sp.]